MQDPVRPFPHSLTPPDLKAALRVARIEDAERSSVAADLRGAELSRLEMLNEFLTPVFAQLPREAELFDQGLVPGDKPRLFVDMIAFVEMARDRRTFRFLQDTRAGRMLLCESEKIETVADAVTSYFGRRLVEREKALAGLSPEIPPPPTSAAPDMGSEATKRYSFADTLFAFVMGMIAGATLLFAYGWVRATGLLPPLP
jgi:hypothetical protein